MMTNLSFFFFNDTATTEIYPLSLHDALPIFRGPAAGDQRRPRRGRGHGHRGRSAGRPAGRGPADRRRTQRRGRREQDRKSTRLNSSHLVISYAVFCLKKKNEPDRTVSVGS